MKMEELNEFYEEFDGESILEYFDGEENDSHMLNETDSFYFYDDGQGMSLKYKSPKVFENFTNRKETVEFNPAASGCNISVAN